jgi:uncharacterized protein
MRILAISDITVSALYNHHIKARFPDVGLLISCGDLPNEYQEYLVSSLDAPYFYVMGNHDQEFTYDSYSRRQSIAGGTNLHNKAVFFKGIILAGIEGSLKYREGPYQYSQSEMWTHVFNLIPRLLINRIRYGRYLDIFVTHAPPAGIHDKPDLPHQGIYAFRWFIEKFQPRYHFHGHIHVYRPDEPVDTLHGKTRVINAFGFKDIEISP